MSRIRRTTAAALTLIPLAAPAAGCGEKDEPDLSAVETTTPSASTPTTPTAPAPTTSPAPAP